MRKCLSVLLAVLMLLNVLPFSFAVSAADEPTIMISCEDEVVNAGEEIEVTVNLENLEDPGLIGAQVEIGFDPDVFELVTYYDEDEEMWMPPIEVGPKFNASSNKYITFPHIDEETGYMERCWVLFNRATATATQAVKTNLFYTVTFRVKDDALSGTYELYVKDYKSSNIVAYGGDSVECALESAFVIVAPPCEHQWNTATCTEPATCALCGEQEGEALGHSYGEGVVTQAPTCTATGVKTYTCSECGNSYTEDVAKVNHVLGTDNKCAFCGVSMPAIVISCEDEVVNAGEEIEVTVNLENLEDPGLIGAQVEIGFDPDVFELVTYYDEDEEMWMPLIEVGPKFSASYNKYITFPHIDEETGYMERCWVLFNRATATATQAVKTNLFYIVTFKVKGDAPSGTYELYVKDHKSSNIVAYGNVAVDCALESTSVTVNGIPRCEHQWNTATCTEPATCTLCGDTDGEALGHSYGEGVVTQAPTCATAGVMTYTCSKCEHSYTETIATVDHSYGEGVVTQAPTCTATGVMTYTCSKCEHSYTETIATVDHSYGEGGATQNPYCTVCGALSAPTIVIEPSVEEVEAGEEFQVTVNLKNNPGLIGARVEIGFDPDVFELVTFYDEDEEGWFPMIEVGPKFSASHNKYITFGPIDEETGFSERCLVQYYRYTATTATQVRTEEHFYTATFKVKGDAPSGTYPLTVKYDSENFFNLDFDTVNFAAIDSSVTVLMKDVLDQEEVFHSVMDTENGNGLAFRFTAHVKDMGIAPSTTNVADYTNATIRYNGENYKLVGMGAIVTNKAIVGENESSMTLGSVNGKTILDVPAVYLCDLETYSCAFATRVINIPDDALESIVYARPYYVIEVDGEQITLYGDIDSTSCQEVLDNVA